MRRPGRTRVIQYGLGPIGIEAAKRTMGSATLELVGAVDTDPQKAGRDLSEILGVERRTGMAVSDRPSKLFEEVHADIVVHTTTSFLRDVHGQIAEIVSSGINVVSSAEELFYPRLKSPQLAKELDALATAKGVTVLGCGVNPGFVMDTLPLFATAVCAHVDSVSITRVVDASTRRLPLQRKIGAGLDPEDFRRRVAEGTLGHIGLVESLAFLADGLGWKRLEVHEEIRPMIAEREITTQYLRVKKGKVAGIKHTARGTRDGRVVIDLELRMHVGAQEPHDLILIEGQPRLELRINGGIAGDVATVSTLVNYIPLVVEAQAGLVTTRDLPMPSILS